MPEETAKEALQSLVAVCITFLILNSFFVILRFISRFHVKQQKVGWDDILIIAGYVANIGLCVDAFVIWHYETTPADTPAHLPIGEPWQIKTQLEPALKAIYAAEQLLYASFTFPKLSLLFLYLRVFEGKWFRITTYALIGVTTVCWLVFALIAAFLCQPVAYYWDRLIPGGHCVNIDTFWRTIPPFNIVTDIVALILPVPVVWRLEASKMKKIGVIFIFFTGGVGLITCCIRWGVYLTHSAQTIVPAITGPMLSWAIIEGSMYLIAACLPMMRPIFVALTPKWLISKWDTYTGTSAVYHQKSTSNRVSGPVLRRANPRNPNRHFSRLHDGPEVMLSPADAEKGASSDAGCTRVPTADEIPLEDMGGGIAKKVDVTVTQAPA